MSQRTFERNAQRRQDASRRRESVRRRRAGLVAGVAGVAALAGPAAAQAEPIVVDSGGDTTTPGATNLRDAIAQAETSPTDSTITFASNVRGTITLDNRILYDADDGGALDIQGPGAGALTVTRSDTSGIFSFSGEAPISVSGLTLTGSPSSPFGPSVGGAIDSADTDLTVANASIVGNTAKYGGGGIAQEGGSLTIENSHVDNNDLKFTAHTTTGNGNFGSGGGILVESAPLSISGSTVNGNKAENGVGGGIATQTSQLVSARQKAIIASDTSVEITDSTVSGNRAGDGGGGKFFTGDDVSITRSTFSGNTATGAELSGSDSPAITGTQPGTGGGAAIIAASSSVRDSTFSGNRALKPEDLPVVEPPVEDPPVVDPPVTDPPDTTARSTRTTRVDDGTVGGLGGGIVYLGPDLEASNSTVANNAAGIAGGILTLNIGDADDRSAPGRVAKRAAPALRAAAPKIDAPSVDIDNATVSGNSATTGGGGIVSLDGFGLSSSIVAGNTSGGANPDIASPNGSVDSEYSLVQVPGDTLTTDPAKPTITGQAAQLGGLTNNGGPTETLLPALTSPAIDKGTANELTTDQRGFARTVDLSPANASDGTDIGAVEVAAPATTPGTTPNRPVTPSSVPASCSRRAISLTDARVKNGKVVLKGLVGSRFYGKQVTIQTDPKGAKASGYSKTTSVTASKSAGTFTVSVPKPTSEDYPTVRYRAKIGKATSPALKLPQSLTAKSVKSAKGTITVTGRVRKAVLGKRNKVAIRRLVCGRYRTMGSTKPDAEGNYTLTFKATALRGVALYRAESSVLVRPGSKTYVKQYARAISIKTTGQTG